MSSESTFFGRPFAKNYGEKYPKKVWQILGWPGRAGLGPVFLGAGSAQPRFDLGAQLGLAGAAEAGRDGG